jgi:release factor glutamine methyltransferase
MKISEWIEIGRERLSQAPITCRDPRLHIQQILTAVSSWSTAEIYIRWEEEMPLAFAERLETFLLRRLTGEPFQYIAGYEWFWNSRFKVGPGALIPRRETELVVEQVLKAAAGTALKVAELGAGTGNIGISAVLENSKLDWHAFELNPASLPYLSTNRADLLSSFHSYFIHEGDFFCEAVSAGPYDLIVANPPYIGREELSGLDAEVQWEPKLALDGGVDGIEVLMSLVGTSQRLLRDNGKIITEIGSTQNESVEQLMAKAGFLDIETLKDLSGLPRVVLGRKGNGDGRTPH